MTENRRRRVELVDTLEDARKMRETFMDREPEREKKMPFTWPAKLQHVGRCLSVEYSSDKWKKKADWEDYKHVAEAPQAILVQDDFLVYWQSPKERVPVYGPWMELLDEAPKHFAELAKFLGLQVRLFSEEKSGKGVLPRGDKGVMQVRVTGAKLGGARVPDTGEPFLFVYNETSEGIHCIITGKELDVEKDGIVG